MDIQIKTRHIDLTPDIKSYLNEKLDDVTRLTDPDDTSAWCSVQLAKKDEQHQTGDIYTAKVNLHIAGRRFRATAREGSMEAAIDEVKDQLMKELRRHKDKQHSFVRRGGRAVKEFLQGLRQR